MKRTFSRIGGAALPALASILVTILVLVPLTGRAQVPQTISYQGSLSDAKGNPVTATVEMVFRLYGSPTAKIALWGEGQAVTVENGIFSVVLGANELNPLAPGLFQKPLWLGIAVDADAEMAPRQALSAVGYGLRAKTVETDTLSALSCGTGRIAKWNGSAWACAADVDTDTDTQLTEAQVEGFVTNGALDLAGGTTLGGAAVQTGPDADALGALSCAADEVAKWNGAAWACAAPVADQTITTQMLASDFTIDVSQVTGYLGSSFSVLIPDVIDNTAFIEIAGVMGDLVVVTSGPGLEIQRIPGFLPNGKPSESPGPNMETPFIFEYSGPAAADLQLLHDNFIAFGELRSMSLIVKDLAGLETFRWNLFEYGLTTIEPGSDGRNRYIFEHQLPPDNLVRFENSAGPFPADISFNPATDTRVEIGGILHGPYPVVVDNTTERTLTMTFDYVEGGEVFDWVRTTAMGLGTNTSISVIEESGGVEIGRTNYFECFPIRYQQFTGFGQTQKIKERVVIAYGWSEPA